MSIFNMFTNKKTADSKNDSDADIPFQGVQSYANYSQNSSWRMKPRENKSEAQHKDLKLQEIDVKDFEWKCIYKHRDDKDRITGYELVNINGFRLSLYSDQLKRAMAAGEIKVFNLTLTSDNRLVDAAEQKDFKENLAGGNEYYKRQKYYEKTPITSKFLKEVQGKEKYLEFKKVDDLEKIRDKAVVMGTKLYEVGGVNFLYTKNVVRAVSDKGFIFSNKVADKKMFTWLEFDTVKISGLDGVDLSECTDMSMIFKQTHVNTVILEDLDVSKVEDIDSLFSSASVKNIIIRNCHFDSCKTASTAFSGLNDCTITLDNVTFRSLQGIPSLFASSSIEFKGVFDCTGSTFTNIEYAFCSATLKNLDFRCSGVTPGAHKYLSFAKLNAPDIKLSECLAKIMEQEEK